MAGGVSVPDSHRAACGAGAPPGHRQQQGEAACAGWVGRSWINRPWLPRTNALLVTRARYRDLLGTAETIVEMNGKIKDVESNLTDIGRRCNPRLIDKKSAHLDRLKRDSLENSMMALQQPLRYRSLTKQRCGGSSLFGATRPSAPLHVRDLETAEEAQLSASDCQASCHLETPS